MWIFCLFSTRPPLLTQLFKSCCTIFAHKYTLVVFLSVIFEFLCKSELMKELSTEDLATFSVSKVEVLLQLLERLQVFLMLLHISWS